MYIKLNRFKRISVFGSAMTECPVSTAVYSDDYVVDRSKFCPIAEALSSAGPLNVSGAERQQYYDFPDGKDTQIKIPTIRLSSVKDLAEMSVVVQAETKNVQTVYNKELQRAQDDAAMQQIRSSTMTTPEAKQ